MSGSSVLTGCGMVADMDFPMAPAIADRLQSIIDGMAGYQWGTGEYAGGSCLC